MTCSQQHSKTFTNRCPTKGVVTWPVDRKGNTLGDGLKLTELQAALYDRDTEIPKIQMVDASKFIREITPRLTDDRLPPLLIRNRLALWLAADVLVDVDENRHVVCWQDILAGDNQTEENAWQHETLNRPLLVDAAIGGKPALHFDGHSSFMVTTPLATTDDQTLFFAFQRGREPHVNQAQRTLINYNGPPINLAENLEINPFRILQIDDAEVLIFNDGLRPKDIANVTRYLAAKYNVELRKSNPVRSLQ